MIERFFSNVLADQTCEENLKKHIEGAYAATLKQYHNWFIQKSFSVSLSFCRLLNFDPSNRKDIFEVAIFFIAEIF